MMIDLNRWHLFQQAMTPWQWGLVVVGVIAAIWLIFWLKSYFREDADDADETLEMLTQFRDLHQQGGLSDDEFRLIRGRLARSAQEALVAGRVKPNVISAELIPPNLTGPKHDISKQSTAIHATAENEAAEEDDDEVDSARMPDQEAD